MKNESAIERRLLTIQEAARYLGRSGWSVRRLVWAGELPCVRGGRRVHIDVMDLEVFIAQHKVREG
jgi:excisionase family DNA binding protein